MKTMVLRGGRGNPSMPTTSVDWIGVYDIAGQIAIVVIIGCCAALALFLTS